LLVSALFLAYFLLTTNRLQKSVTGQAGLADVGLYTVSSFPAFQEMLRSPGQFVQSSSLTFGFVSRVLNEIDPVVFAYPEYVRPPVYIPTSTNVFTYLDAFFLDFGMPGVYLFPFLYGLLTSALFLAMRAAPSIGKVYVAALFGLCIIQSAGVNRFGTFGIWLWVLAPLALNRLLPLAFPRQFSQKRLPQPLTLDSA
jgi:oligosaccharide repeat unit polymerase